MQALTFVSLMASNADPFYAELALYLASRLDRPVRFVGDIDWQARQRLLDHGQVDIGAICGAPYILRRQLPSPPICLLAAPVMRAPRYAARPVYFSDVITRVGVSYSAFADLRGTRWVYNEPNSYSGYHVVCAYLAELGEDERYFGKVLASGSHEQSLWMVRTGAADASAIDSIVLEQAIAQQPELASRLQIVATLGPSPAPPLVARADLPPSLRQSLHDELVSMHTTDEGQRILGKSPVSRFVDVDDSAYDLIRRQLDRAVPIRLAPS